ncbi:MAG TPA: hypothetical protein VF981_17700 [Gemmatimonadaceae bacterium]
MAKTTGMRLGISLFAAFAGLGMWATAVHGQSPARAVEDLLRYHLDGGARWQQDNPGFQPGSGLPAFWVRLLRWGPSHEVIVADAFAVSEDGRCAPVAHMVYFWDIQNGRVAVSVFSAAGVRGEGYLEAKGPAGTQLLSTIRLPDGNSLQIREYSDNTRSDAYTTRADRFVDGAWVAGDSVTWRRSKDTSPCG